jgi:hypothetical protein
LHGFQAEIMPDGGVRFGLRAPADWFERVAGVKERLDYLVELGPVARFLQREEAEPAP